MTERSREIVLSDFRPTPEALEVAPGAWLVRSSAEVDAMVDNWAVPVERPRRSDVDRVAPVRADLPQGHPLRGRRALRTVPAGSGDIVVDDVGVQVVDRVEPKPIEVAPVDDGEAVGEVDADVATVRTPR